ncbi:uncharacterized protein SCHCODRAFT_02639512 [Schizophyllum commune H4-8]|uniref:uncharacterized protein n=1 Tax=Schizophyllum commune (strain H4-8 / FGSC 9210) TaxID=578458 RepID=UPI002160E746|nr:uncharacterized protein SCHCODRAFT_02639512 [Schizophyllum commune H4-8]KAI5888023.1 hypothetical protein SCHCODRAFT_02639512 [Schizophyllum commune H4-8]
MRDLAVQIIEKEAEDEPRLGVLGRVGWTRFSLILALTFHCDGTGYCTRCKEAPSIVDLPCTMSMTGFHENVALVRRSCLPAC